MARIETPMQSVFGSPREARVTTRHPGMPDTLGGLAKSLKNFGSDMESIFNGAVRLGEEGQELALAQARADYNQEVQTRLDSEVNNLEGISAADAGERARRIFESAEQRQLERLSAYGARPSQRFQLYAKENQTTRMSHVVNTARGKVKSATIQLETQNQKNSAALHGTTGNEREIETLLESQRKAYELTNGVIDREAIATFDKNAERGFVALGGQRYPVKDGIVHGISPDGRGVKLADMRERLLKENLQFEQSRQNSIDLARQERVTNLLKWGDVRGAEEYVAKHDPRAKGANALSERAFEALSTEVQRARTRLNASLDASRDWSAAVADYAQTDKKSFGGKLWSPGMEMKAQELLEEQLAKARKDETGIEQKKYDALYYQINQSRAQSRAWEKASREQIIDEFSDYNGTGVNLFAAGNEGRLIEKIQGLPESYIKDDLMRTAARKMSEAHIRKRNLPAAKASRQAKVVEIASAMATGTKIDLNRAGENNPNLRFDSTDRKQLSRAIALCDFTADELQQIKNFQDGFPMNIASEQVSSVLNGLCDFTVDEEKGKVYFTGQSVNALAPELVLEVQKVLGMDVERAQRAREGKLNKEDLLAVRRTITKLLQAKNASEPSWWGGMRTVKLPEFLGKAVSEDGSYTTDVTYGAFCDLAQSPEQIAEFEKVLNGIRLELRPRRIWEDEEELKRTNRAPGSVDAGTAKGEAEFKYRGKTYYRTKESDAKEKAAEAKAQQEMEDDLAKNREHARRYIMNVGARGGIR